MDVAAGWYAVALADGLARGTSAGTRLFGRELVVWRDAVGASHVWEDRCPHRGMRLSFGFVRDNHIACLYHGWQYDTAARCRYIPAHPDIQVPDSIRVATYASVERLGMVWAYSETDRDAPDLAPPAECAPVTPVRSLTIDAPVARVLAGLGGAGAAGPVRLVVDDAEIVAAVQPLSETGTVLHLVIAGPPDNWRGAGQKRVSSWGEALRRKLELPDIVPPAAAASLGVAP